ncbi:MAG: DNA polymerase III subunit delta [Gemmatimonadota bacterium]|nr:DNA polymerase III subunit delta [Gemmatimonadota bacterium]
MSRALGGETPTGAWFLHGDATRLRDDAARELVDAALDPTTRDFNFDRFRSDDVKPEELAATLAMPPMMAERRVVWLSDVQKLTPTGRKIVLSATERLPNDLVLVVTGTIPKGSKAAFYRDLKSRCRTLEWGSPREAELPGWILTRARTRWNLELAAPAANALGAAIGTDLSRLDAELERLADLDRDQITVEVIDELIPRTRRMDRWTWLDAVTEREYARALRELEDLLTSESGVGLVAGLVEQHLLVGLAVEGGAGRVKKALSETGRGYLSWKANVYGRQAQAWRVDEIDRAIRHLHRADRLLKSGGKDRAVLSELLLTLERERRERT